MRAGTAHQDANAACIAYDNGPDYQQLQPDHIRVGQGLYTLDGVLGKNFIIMIRVDEADETLTERAKRYGRVELRIDLAEIPQL